MPIVEIRAALYGVRPRQTVAAWLEMSLMAEDKALITARHFRRFVLVWAALMIGSVALQLGDRVTFAIAGAAAIYLGVLWITRKQRREQVDEQ